ncbi:MAG: hypothetical protein JSS83_26275 [Cyanobacteria bacterium SZAS LIN-3]|nr:hypothetical protein [Cyanobacteria bacterium SZAS LIN-3]
MNRVRRCLIQTALTGLVLMPTGLYLQAGAQEYGHPGQNVSLARTEKLPVKEVTIFKDGHALVVREGKVALNKQGEAILEELPNPVLGTFFPYSLEPGQALVSVTAGKKKVETSATALSIGDLLEANPGADVSLVRTRGGGAPGETTQLPPITGKLAAVPVPRRSIEELNAVKSDSTAAGATSAAKSALVEIDTDSGATFLPIDKIESLSFKGKHSPTVKSEELKNVLTLRLPPAFAGNGSARLGMMYVEKGLRWIPSYKITLNGHGRAKLKLEATLINDLTDLDDVATQIVVGVPSFVAEDEIDPIALAKTVTEVTAVMRRDSYARMNFSNAIMTQTASDARFDQNERQTPAPSVDGGSKSEDLFVFGIKHVSLKKGERMVVPVLETDVEYEDLYTLDIPMVPPQEVQHSSGQPGPKSNEGLRFTHKIRLQNTGSQPFTTAPALLVENIEGKETVLAQSLMTYAAPGGASDLTVTTAVDLKVSKHEEEAGRQESATVWLDNKYARINEEGQLSVTNYGREPVKIEVSRRVLGQVDSTSPGGKMQMLNALNEGPDSQFPAWWPYYSWPNWWSQMNGVGRFTFQHKIEPGQKADFTYKWHYFWR